MEIEQLCINLSKSNLNYCTWSEIKKKDLARFLWSQGQKQTCRNGNISAQYSFMEVQTSRYIIRFFVSNHIGLVLAESFLSSRVCRI